MTRSAEDLCYLTIREAGALLRDRKLSPVELTRAHLDRVEQLDGTLQAFITVLGDSALDQARAAETEIVQGAYRGPLHGIPIGLMDLYDTAGVRTTAGSRVNADRVPTVDSTVAARFRSAGAILLGKLAMNEFAVGGPDPSAGFPISRNPWNTARSTGGSSTGSAAAVASGLCMGAMGSCTRGSIRAPASFCNIVGLKPTYGRVSRAGVIPLSWTLDHCGPMTRTVEDAALMLAPIAGRDPADPTTAEVPVQAYASELERDVRGLRIGVPRHFFFASRPEVDPETQARADEALKVMEGLGASVEEVEIPALHQSDAAALVILLGEGYAYHERTLRARPHDYGDLLRTELQVGALFTSADYIQAQRLRSALRRQYAEALHRGRCNRVADVRDRGSADRRPWTGGHRHAQLHRPIQPDRPACGVGSLRVHGGRAARGPADSRPALRRGDGSTGGIRLRAGVPVVRAASAGVGGPCWPGHRRLAHPPAQKAQSGERPQTPAEGAKPPQNSQSTIA